jgi:hypothetical protein
MLLDEVDVSQVDLSIDCNSIRTSTSLVLVE